MNMPGFPVHISQAPPSKGTLLAGVCAVAAAAFALALPGAAPAGSSPTRIAAGPSGVAGGSSVSAGKGSRPSASNTAAATAARARGRAYMTGIGDQKAEMFGDPLWQRLGTKIVRYVVPYDVAVRPQRLQWATEWIDAAEGAGQKILVAFYHSADTPMKNPSVAVYRRDVAKFVKLFPHVREYEAWDEVNRGNEPPLFVSPSAAQDAEYYQALKRTCKPCTVVGLDVLDGENIGSTLRYIEEFKREIYRLRTLMPSVWGLHNYSDVNRFGGLRTHELVAALGGEVWLTETGGVVKFGNAFPNRHGSGLVRAAKALKFMFALAAANPRVKRLYIYDWTGGNSSTRFDAGLMNAHDRPRPGYVVVCRQLHAAKCNVHTVRN
jgi:hypothetical protein